MDGSPIAHQAAADTWAARRSQLRARRAAYERVLFVVLCLVWGTTWIALKAGAMAVPPGFFSGTRWTTAGLLLLAWRWAQGQRIGFPPRLAGRLGLVALLMIALNAVVMLYGLRLVGSGLAAVINSALTPIALLGFGVAAGQERFSRRQLGAIALGVAGIVVLFGPSAFRGELDGRELLGAIGVILGCLCYAAGSVLARPLMRSLSPAHVAASTNLVGGLMLLVAAVLFEPGARAAASGHWGWAAWAAWLYMLGPASLGATTIYFLLVRDWGASRTGTYAFVSPAIAVLLGVTIYGERLDAASAAGMALMLLAAALVLRR
ncbi:MAG: EamA family transporter [Alphaproteobacteria bacterium]|nr:EamA family transporter [Alphaproteobacteria bacterium]